MRAAEGVVFYYATQSRYSGGNPNTGLSLV